jgi:uncharacterized membrane protein
MNTNIKSLDKVANSVTAFILLTLLLQFVLYCTNPYASLAIFFFIPWNLFLAWIPLYFANKFGKIGANRLWFLPWFLFLPNSFYIWTDVIHAVRWYKTNCSDTGLYNGCGNRTFELVNVGMLSLTQIFYLIIIILSTIVGAYWGVRSMGVVYKLYTNLSKNIVSILFSIQVLLIAFAIVLGRFTRLNSWDVLLPHILIPKLWETWVMITTQQVPQIVFGVSILWTLISVFLFQKLIYGNNPTHKA